MMINILGTSIFIFDDNYFGNLHLRLQRRYTLWRQLCTLWHARFRRHPLSLLTTVTPFGDIHCRFRRQLHRPPSFTRFGDAHARVQLQLYTLWQNPPSFDDIYTLWQRPPWLCTTITHFDNIHHRCLHALATSTFIFLTTVATSTSTSVFKNS